jgi:hypothetical protein
MILTHYYHQDDKPFQTLSSLSEQEAVSIISSLHDRVGAVYQRFRNPAQYLQQRHETERWVRAEFVQKGGKPISQYPQYFVIDRSLWIEDGYNGKSRSIQMPISAFNPDTVSFTYPDSMITYWLKSQTAQVFYHSEYHGRIFTLSEILKIIERFGVPD